MAARSAPRGHLCRRSDYWVEQVDEIMRTEETWMRWLPMDALGLVLDEPLPLAVEPVAPLPDVPGAVDDPVEPGAVDDPVDPALPEPDADELVEADASEPVTST